MKMVECYVNEFYNLRKIYDYCYWVVIWFDMKLIIEIEYAVLLWFLIYMLVEIIWKIEIDFKDKVCA
jgi:hypothetical protein